MYVCLPSVIPTPIRHQLIFAPSICLRAAFFHLLIHFCFSSFFDFPPAHATFRGLVVGIDQIHSSVFFEFLRLSSTVPFFFKVLEASLVFRDRQWLSHLLNLLRLVSLPLSTFRPFSRPSSTFFKFL
jgi:hypothetical protein